MVMRTKPMELERINYCFISLDKGKGINLVIKGEFELPVFEPDKLDLSCT